MKDVELRDVVMQQLYAKRHDQHYQPKSSDFSSALPEHEIVRICRQLKQRNLVDVNFFDTLDGGSHIIFARLTAQGIEKIESGSSGEEHMAGAQINIHGSSNVIVGNHNSQTVEHSIAELVKVIEKSSAPLEQKNEAKNRLRAFLEHPIVAAVAGSAATALLP